MPQAVPAPAQVPQAVSYIPAASQDVPVLALQPLAQAPQAVPVSAEPAPATKKPRGRPPKATSVSEPHINGAGFTLYVGCAPIGCNVTNALDYVNAAHDQLRQARGITHYREVEFGRGPGELCAALEVLLALCEGTENAPSGDVVLGGAQIEEDTASVWFSKAAKVVRAFR
jgi:hypothetical protein